MSFGEYSALEATVPRTAPATDPARRQMHQFLSGIPDNWTLRKYTASPTQNYQVQLGRVIPFKNESRLGVIAALTYRNEQDIEKRSLHTIYGNHFEGANNHYATTLGGTLNLGYQLSRHKFTLQNTYNRKFSDNMWKYTGVDGDNSNMRHDSYNNVTIINQLFQSQLGGEHALGKRNIKVDWFVSAARTDRDQPYSRLVARLNGQEQDHYPPDYFFYDLGDLTLKNGNIFYAELNEKMYNWAANVQLPFRLFGLGQIIKTGYQGKRRTADFGSNLFRIFSFNGSNAAAAGLPYDQVFSSNSFANDLYLHAISGQGRERANAGSSEGYDGSQHLHAWYGMVDMKPLKQLRFIGGVRMESNDQGVSDYVWNEATAASELKLIKNKQTDWLPSVNAIYSLTDKINLRAAWYKTVARPDFREMSSFSYWDYDFFAPVTGSPLRTTYIENADLRLEYYPSPGEVISLSGFYKKFKDPIELMYIGTSGGTAYYYRNLEGALDKGIEFDFRKKLDFIAPASVFFPHMYISGNLTLLDASVTFYPDDAIDEQGNRVHPKRDRPLSGQSPYIINGGLLYAGNSFGVNVSYNRYGKRIVFASPDRSMDEYENPRDLLDLQISYKFLKEKKAELKLNLNDVLNQEQLFYQNRFNEGNPFGFDPGWTSVERYPGVGSGFLPEHKDPKGTSYNKDYDTVVRRYKFGTTYTINFSYRF
ncbi:TonB-dependent receptor domain-containing protein [Chitinophaga sp. 22620]|uniref:TonB-dependent receptor domain-containing protein n=1 Tax=Chitinophaga sp. 22620 TaxID=3453952 RepID=UPI003F82760B